MTPGTSVRITAPGIHEARTGVVVEVSPWAGLGWLRVALDPKPPFPKSELFPADEIEVIAASKRGGQPAQASFWEAA